MIQGISEGPQSVSYAAMADLQNQLAEAILKDPDVESLSSFIGVDGTNPTLNSGRFLINLKPHEKRSLSAAEIIRRLQQEVAGIAGIALYLQPVQDLTIDSSVSRTQYHFVLEDADPKEFDDLGAAAGAAAGQHARAHRRRQRLAAAGPGGRPRDRPRHRGPLRHYSGDRRQRALRFLRPAHRLDHLYPIQPASRDPGGRPLAAEHSGQLCRRSICRHRHRRPTGRCRCRRSCMSSSDRALADHPLRAIPGDNRLFQPGPGHVARGGGRCHRARKKEVGLPASFVTAFQGAAAAFQSSLTNELLLILAALVDHLYRAGRSLREFHSSDHDPLDPAVGRHRRAAGLDGAAGYDLDVIAIIGIVLLIGIVKKNAIMMIDFALEAERSRGCRRAMPSIRPACCASARS